MANLKLKNAQGIEQIYNGVQKVKIPLADGSGHAEFIVPQGSIEITENGTYNIAGKESAIVNVSSPSVEGTAVPIGEQVDSIYFNTSLTIQEVVNYLSQLNYTPFPMGEYEISIYAPFIFDNEQGLSCALIISKIPYSMDDSTNIIYSIDIFRDLTDLDKVDNIFGSHYNDYGGWRGLLCGLGYSSPSFDSYQDSWFRVDKWKQALISIAEWNGIPVGQQNELIKNVISSTPFAAKFEPTYVYASSETEALDTNKIPIKEGQVIIVEPSAKVHITLKAENGGLNNQCHTYIKFGTQPQNNDDCDYFVQFGDNYLCNPVDYSIGTNTITLDVQPTAYIWTDKEDNLAGYKLNDSNLINVGLLNNPTQVQLSDGDTVTIVSTGLD